MRWILRWGKVRGLPKVWEAFVSPVLQNWIGLGPTRHQNPAQVVQSPSSQNKRLTEHFCTVKSHCALSCLVDGPSSQLRRWPLAIDWQGMSWACSRHKPCLLGYISILGPIQPSSKPSWVLLKSSTGPNTHNLASLCLIVKQIDRSVTCRWC